MLKAYQREIKIFAFSQNTNARRVKDHKKRRHFAMASLQSLRCNCFILMTLLDGFCFFLSPMFTNKAIIFLGDG